MKRLMILLPFVLISILGCEKKDHLKKDSVTLLYQDQSFVLSSQSKIKGIWQTKKFKDPNSGNELSYSGYTFRSLLERLKINLKKTKNIELKMTAQDGYVVYFSLEDVLSSDGFLALDVSAYKSKGIYNKSLGKYFDWRPGYFLFFNKKSGFKSSSPYQLVSIEIKDKVENPILAESTPETKAGAQVFLKTCNKCHSHLGYGGQKGPPIHVLTIRWSDDNKLKKFLRSPSQELDRKIEMSAFKGSEQAINDLIQYLRSIEFKSK